VERPEPTLTQNDESTPLSREVLEGVRRRERQALSVFFGRFAPRIYDLAYRMLGEKSAAEDVTQEVFLRVYRGAATLDPERRPDPWVLRITQNACRDVWRSRHHRMAVRSRSAEDADSLGELPSPAPDPEHAASETERRQVVQRAILELPTSLREVVLLHDYEDLSHPEIADVLGTSHAAVRKRYSRALSKLGELLGRKRS
jgi:RNA polymerase sigma-70 factor (ECF subfamily)